MRTLTKSFEDEWRGMASTFIAQCAQVQERVESVRALGWGVHVASGCREIARLDWG